MADDRDVIPLSRFSALIHGAPQRGLKRVDAILSDKDPAARVAAMPVQDLFFLIKEVGLADASDLVALATPAQFQGFLDLDGWDRDVLRDLDIRPWLAALIEAGEQKLSEVWRQLDPELTALIFKRWTRIYNLAEEEVPDDEEPPFVPTPDRFFLIKITADDAETVRLVETLVDRLYRVDQVLARHTIRAAASEPFAELEETAHRWRSGRMQDLGYADYHEALEVYRPIDLGDLTIGEQSADRPGEPFHLPVPLAEPTLSQPFLGLVLGRLIDGEEARRIEAALITLINKVLSANRIPPGDPAVAAAGAAQAAGTLSLGLETLARGDVDRGIEALRTVSLVRLHRLGHSVTLQLARLARVLAPRAFRADEPARAMLSALTSLRPRFPRALEERGANDTRPFTQVSDVRAVAHALAVLAAQVTFVHDALAVDLDALSPLVTIGTVARTHLARAALGPVDGWRPLTRAEVVDLRRRGFAGARLTAETRARVAAAADEAFAARHLTAPQEFSDAVAGWTDDLERILGSLDVSQPPEPRFLEGVLVE